MLKALYSALVSVIIIIVGSTQDYTLMCIKSKVDLPRNAVLEILRSFLDDGLYILSQWMVASVSSNSLHKPLGVLKSSITIYIFEG